MTTRDELVEFVGNIQLDGNDDWCEAKYVLNNDDIERIADALLAKYCFSEHAFCTATHKDGKCNKCIDCGTVRKEEGRE